MRILRAFPVLAFIAAALAAQPVLAASNFYGDVVHVSVNNVKVENTKTHQTLSFLVTPEFDQVLSADGKATYQMKDLKPGQYVRVIYDQKALGARHADKIYILRSNNMRANKQIPH